MNSDIYVSGRVLLVNELPHIAALLHIINVYGKITHGFKREKIMMQFLGKEIIVAKIQDIFQAPRKTLIIKIRKKIKNRMANYLVGRYVTVQFHPFVPLVNFQIAIENNDPGI
jgi:hypothetical protein